MGLEFSASRKLRTRREYLLVQGEGARIAMPGFIMVLRARSDSHHARLGITVTRKFGGAVMRNRAKRLIREAVRCHPELLPAGIDVIIIPKAGRMPEGLAVVVAELSRAAPKLQREAGRLRSVLAKTAERPQTGGSTGAHKP